LNLFGKMQRIGAGAEAGGIVRGEVMGAIRSPSIASFTNLISESSATGKALAKLGAAAGPVGLALLGVVAVAAVLVAAWKLLAAAADYVKRKFEEITRFSGAMMFASANERLRGFIRQMQDAQKNGAAYAKVQLAATAAEDARHRMMMSLNPIIADMAEAFHNLMESVYELLTPVARLFEIINQYVNLGQLVATSILNTIGGMLVGPFAPILTLLLGIQGATAQTARNTAPANTATANAWFTSDVRAMTGRPY
jgi:hypothetical protein